jgi:hypothetical protein
MERPLPSKRIVEQDDATLRRLREELAQLKATLAEREAEMVAARSRFEQELQDQLAASSKLAAEMLERDRALKSARDGVKADKDWKEGEAARIADAEARGEAKAEARAAKALAEAQTQLERIKTRTTAEAARERSDEAERKRLRDELQRLKKSLTARDEELTKSKETWQRDSESKFAKAEGAWRDRESRELADARQQWQERSERALSEAKVQFERAQTRAEAEAAARARGLEAEVERLQDELTFANSAIADREGDIADIQARLDEQTARADALSLHENEIARLKAQIAQGERTLLEAQERMAQAKADWRAQSDLAKSQMEQAKADWRAQSDATLAARLADWKRDEAQRLQSAEAEVQGQAQIQLSRSAKRIKELEAERDQLRAHADALQKRGDSEDIKQLRREFGHLQALLAERELEVAQLKLDGEHARERWTAEARITLQRAEHEWKADADAAEREGRKATGTRRTVRDVVLVGSLSALAVMVYLYGWPTDWVMPAPRPAVVTAAMSKPASPAQPAAHMVTILKSANVRSAPSKTAGIVTTLPRSTELASLERHGNWVRVKLSRAKASDGWVYATYLADKQPARP